MSGCGKFFEGSAEEMHTALNKTLGSLPDDTLVYVSRAPVHPAYLCLADHTAVPRGGCASRLTDAGHGMQTGHEYTKSNVKFAKSVQQSEALAKLEAFADANRDTQGTFTIGDEKVKFHCSYPRD